uniref:Uncharacterized protein n=1 Tax=Mycobacterium riyadhense TaxID=486698 RepID=A0A653F623_9MYCO|nr:hypothetical protein BIN_B_05534 [Mycobacterium riyadhense]
MSHHSNMAEAPESTEPPSATAQLPYSDRSDRPSRVDHLWALVGITAGVVFIVAVIFFSGFFMGRATDGPYGGHGISNVERDGMCPMMGSGGGMAPGMMGPGGSMGPPGQTGPPTPHPTPHP